MGRRGNALLMTGALLAAGSGCAAVQETTKVHLDVPPEAIQPAADTLPPTTTIPDPNAPPTTDVISKDLLKLGIAATGDVARLPAPAGTFDVLSAGNIYVYDLRSGEAPVTEEQIRRTGEAITILAKDEELILDPAELSDPRDANLVKMTVKDIKSQVGRGYIVIGGDQSLGSFAGVLAPEAADATLRDGRHSPTLSVVRPGADLNTALAEAACEAGLYAKGKPHYYNRAAAEAATLTAEDINSDARQIVCASIVGTLTSAAAGVSYDDYVDAVASTPLALETGLTSDVLISSEAAYTQAAAVFNA